MALVVRPYSSALELLLIKRAPRLGDPWSGHIALPGGKRDPLDPDLRFTAIRETHEEVGINLADVGSYLGSLDEVEALGADLPPLAISPYAFAVPPSTHAAVSPEVDQALWVPLSTLVDPGARAEYLHAIDEGESLRFPALRYRGHTIWGLTYRIVSQFMALVEPATEAPQ